MINESFMSNPTKCGTAGGLLTVLLINISGNEVPKTVVLAMIGASVSFIISMVWKLLLKKWKR